MRDVRKGIIIVDTLALEDLTSDDVEEMTYRDPT